MRTTMSQDNAKLAEAISLPDAPALHLKSLFRGTLVAALSRFIAMILPSLTSCPWLVKAADLMSSYRLSLLLSVLPPWFTRIQRTIRPPYGRMAVDHHLIYFLANVAMNPAHKNVPIMVCIIAAI